LKAHFKQIIPLFAAAMAVALTFALGTSKVYAAGEFCVIYAP
jgi:hypothetical protein